MKIVILLVLSICYLNAFYYPSHSCRKPSKPYKPYSFSSNWEVDSYNSEVRTYNSDLEEYIECIEQYIEEANSDIKKIQREQQEAIDDANRIY